MRQFRNVDPTQQAKTLIASGQVKAVGQETIGGVKTVHYTGTTPLAAYLEQLDPSMRDTVQKGLASKGVTEVRTELWIDAQYQVRRCHMVMGDTDLTSDYGDYGKPVNVVEPPAAETTDLADMLGNLDLSDLTT